MPDRRPPEVVLFDVNETLSDFSSIGGAFVEIGTTVELAATWFAGVLRDGFALTVAGSPEPFARVAEESLRSLLSTRRPDRPLQAAVDHVLAALRGLEVHPDVAEGVAALADHGLRLVTLTNGAAGTSEQLLERAGIRHHFERHLSVEEAGPWKPDPRSYATALQQCGVEAGDALLVAVHPWDIHGAACAGLRTGWLAREGRDYPSCFTAPELTAGTLSDLAAQLG